MKVNELKYILTNLNLIETFRTSSNIYFNLYSFRLVLMFFIIFDNGIVLLIVIFSFFNQIFK